MASLQGTKIKDTYKSLLKVADNGEIEVTDQEITDGLGQGTGVSLNTQGDVIATGTVSFDSLKDTDENITITKFVDEADGIAANDNDTSIPTSAAVKDYVDSNVTAQDLDITDGTNNGSVDLDSQSLTFTGDAGVSATVSGQTLTLDSSALQSQITSNDSDITALQAADTTLQSNIDAEETARIAADSALQTQITNNDTDITALQAADTTLQNNIDAEETARIAADAVLQANINLETANRTTADTTLQNNINAEASTRASADTTLQGNIDTEEAARIAADTDLANDISTEASTRSAADTALQGQITSNDGDISGLDTRLTAAESNITSNDSDISALDGRLTTAEAGIFVNDQDITNLNTRLTAAEGNITSNDTDISALQSGKQDISEKGQANGYAPLDGSAKVPIANLPDSVVGQVEYQGTWNASTDTPTLPAASGVKGHYYVVSTGGTYETISYAVGDWVISNGTSWEKVDNTDAVTSVFGRLGNVVANEADYSSFYPLISDLNTTNSNVSGLDTRLTTAEGDITAIEAKTDFITVTQTVNLDTIESDTAANTSKLAGIEAGAQVNTVDSVNTQTGAVVLDADDIDDTTTTNKFTTQAEIDKLAGIEALADVTDATNVAAAGALMSGTAQLSDLIDVSSASPTDGQVLTYDTVNGWQPEDSQGGEEYTISEISTNTTAQVNFLYVLTANLTLTLPATPSVGNRVALSNMSGTTTPTVARNGNLIAGLAEDLTIDVLNLSVEFIYSGASQGWIIFVDSILGTSGGGGSVDGNGTTNYISKWSDANTLTDSVIFDNGTNVGIGTASPDGTLHVHTGSAGTVTAEGAADNLVVESSGDGGISILTPDANFGKLTFGSPTKNEGAIVRYNQASATMTIGTEIASGLLQFRTGGGIEAMRIDAIGNVGIGTSTPFATGGYNTLSINGTNGGQIIFQTSGNQEGFIYNTSSLLDIGTVSGNDVTISAGATEKVRILSSGGITFNGDTAAANALDDYEEGTWTAAFAGSATTATGYYTKIGNMVHIEVYGNILNVTSAVDAVISGLPFTALGNPTVSIAHNTSTSAATDGGFLNGTSITLTVENALTPNTTSIGNPKYIMLSGTYITA